MHYLSREAVEASFQKYLELAPKFREHDLTPVFEVNSEFRSSKEGATLFCLNFYVYDRTIKQITYLTLSDVSTSMPTDVCVDDPKKALEVILAKRNNTATKEV